MLELALMFWTAANVAPAFGPLAADVGAKALTSAEVLFAAWSILGVVAAIAYKPIEASIERHIPHHA